MPDFCGKLAMPKTEAVSHALPQFTLILFSFVAGKFLLANPILLGVIKILLTEACYCSRLYVIPYVFKIKCTKN